MIGIIISAIANNIVETVDYKSPSNSPYTGIKTSFVVTLPSTVVVT